MTNPDYRGPAHRRCNRAEGARYKELRRLAGLPPVPVEPTTTDRGYGADHQRVRAHWAPIVAAGQAQCAEVICLEPTRWIRPGAPWDLAHRRTPPKPPSPVIKKWNSRDWFA